MRFAKTLFLLVVIGSCVFAFSKPKSHHLFTKDDTITVFLTGNELGVLKPCGCFGGQLGGIEKRSAVFEQVPAARRLVVSTGSLVETDSEQDLIKFKILVQAFGLLEYDLVNLAQQDIEIARQLGFLSNVQSIFNVISSEKIDDLDLPSKYEKTFALGGKRITVNVASFDIDSGSIQNITNLFDSDSSRKSFNILLLNSRDPKIVKSVQNTGVVDCIVCQSDLDEPELLFDSRQSDDKGLVISVGKFGKYVCRLDITKIEKAGKNNVKFSTIPVTEDRPSGESLVELYKAYQLLVKEAELLENVPRFDLEEGLEYISSESCKLCHDYEYDKWSQKPHSRAYATLEKVGSQFDPECVACHVVGLEYQSGFISEEKTAHLKNVGCENCHGPGSEHFRTFGNSKTSGPMSDCTDCHTPEHSGDYLGNEEHFFEKIIHWREQKNADNVKKNRELKD